MFHDRPGLIDQQVDRVIIKPQDIEIQLRKPESESGEEDASPPCVLTVPWTATAATEKGIVHSASSKPAMSDADRDSLLTAIAKARRWVDDLAEGRAASFAEIAECEGKVERHVRFLAPLAFVSPRMITAIANGSAGAINVKDLAKAAAAHSWTAQELRLRIQ
jgi:hypothetical protein